MESVLVFKNLTQELGEAPDYKKASKMQMTLTPIKRFCTESIAILIDISASLLKGVSKVLDELERTRLSANAIALRDVVKSYTPLRKSTDMLISSIEEFQLKMKGELQHILPKIRGG